MIGVQKQQKQKNVLNRSQRRTPLNVVVERIGTARAVVHGDLSKESLKELLMSELSLISTFKTSESEDTENASEKRTLTEEISETTVKDNINLGDKKDTSKGRDINQIPNRGTQVKSDKDQMKLKSERGEKQYHYKEIETTENENQGKKTDTIKNENQDKKTKLTKKYIQDKGTDTTKNGFEKKNRKESQNNKKHIDDEVAKKNEKYQDNEIETSRKYKQEKGKYSTEEKEFEKKGGRKEYKDKQTEIYKEGKIFSTQKNRDTLQETRKQEGPDLLIKSLFRKTDLRRKEKKFKSGKEEERIRKKSVKGKDSKCNNDDHDAMKKTEEILENETSINEAYKKEEEKSCLSKMSDDKEDEILELSYDGKWLRKYLKKPLVLAMNEIVKRKPKDPVNYLGFWLLNYRNSQENRQGKRDLEKELLEKRNKWNMLHAQTKETSELMIERKGSEHQEEEEENIKAWNFTNYGVS